jgi:O-antigen/teichoic acid export membrane protein
MVVMFFLSPFVVHTLGSLEYGIWCLLTVLTGYMGIFDLGVRASTGRHIILYLGQGDYEKVDQTVRTGLGFFSLIGMLLLAAGIGIGWIFPSVFSSVPESYHGLIRILLPLLAVNVWISAFRAVFSSMLTAHDRFDIARGADVAVLAIRTIGTILILKHGYGICGLTIVVIGCSIIGLLVNWGLALRLYPCLRVWPLSLSRERVKELLGYGIAAFVSAIAIKIIGQTDLVIVGALISVESVTIYSVGAMLIYYSSTFIGQICTTFFPQLQRAAARDEMGHVRWLFFRQVRLTLVFGIPIYIGSMVFAEPFIRLWMLGPEFSESAVKKAAVVMVILAASKLFLLFTLGSNQTLAAIGHIRFNAIIAITEAILNLGFSLIFVVVFHWELWGIAAGTLVARILVRTFVLPWYACQKVGLSWQKFIGV